MSRTLFTIFALSFMVLPLTAQANEAVLPSVIQTALHDAAVTGNPLVVDAVADRMGNLFPSYRGEIGSYVDGVISPATQVMANINSMLASLPEEKDQGFALFDSHEMNEEGEAASLAEDLNNLEVGAGTENPSIVQ